MAIAYYKDYDLTYCVIINIIEALVFVEIERGSAEQQILMLTNTNVRWCPFYQITNTKSELMQLCLILLSLKQVILSKKLKPALKTEIST